MKLNIRTKLIGSFLVVVALLLVVAAISWNGLNQLDAAADHIVHEALPEDEEVRDLEFQLAFQTELYFEYALTLDEEGLPRESRRPQKEIASLIDSVQKGVTESIKAAEDGTREVGEGVKLAEEARIGRRERLHNQKGWWYILAGFSLIFMGGVFDITDNYDSLNRFLIVGDTETEAFLEKVVGNLVGSLLLFVGLWYWLPLVAALRRAEDDLKKYNEELETRVEDRTAELGRTNKRLNQEVEERARAEEQASVSLQNREVLLKEIHHRVKNNVQVISSLLYLQSNCTEDEETKYMFKESQNRVRSMALIHERLYQSEDLTMVDFAEYAQKLTAELFRSYGLNPMAVTIEINTENVFLSVDTAIPCGLIINELVSNALKHAFPDGRAGEISVRLHEEEDGTYTLSVSDNGVGFPEGVDFRNTESLGMELVNKLTSQIDGAIALNDADGTEFKIAFPEYTELIEVEVTA